MKKLLHSYKKLTIALVLLMATSFAQAASTLTSVTVGAQTGSVTYGTGGNVTYLITVNKSGGGSNSATLSLSGLPAGVTFVSWSTNPVVIAGGGPGSGTSTLTLAISGTAKVAGNSFTVIATAASNTVNNTGTITITPKSTTASLTGSVSKVYDGTTTATLVAANYTLSGIINGDVVNITNTSGSYNTKNVGTGKTVTVTSLVLGGAGAGNYILSSTSVSGTIGTITARTLTITAAANTKVYDGNVTSLTNPTITSGAVQTGDVAAFTQTYDTKNVGTSKVMTPAGTVTDGNSGNNYTYTFVTSSNGTITARALTITGAANSKTYDGTTSSATNPTITSGALQTGDVAAFTETYNNKNVGTSKVMTPAGTVTDGNSGNNYTYTFVTSSNGTITARPLTITAAANTKVYDGNVTSLTNPTITSGAVQTGDVAAFTQTYDNKNVGTSKVMTPGGVVTDGNSGNNYTYTFVTSSNGTITARALTITGAANSKTYDGTTSSATNPTITSGVVQTGDVAAFTQTYDTKNVGTSKVMTPAGTVTDGNSGNNYTYTFVTSSNGTITAASTTISVASNNNPSCFNSSVTFTATIGVTVDAATGTVEFFDGATSLGTSSVSSNQATLTLSSLSAGSHSITATYSGDANYNTSTSLIMTQIVNALPTVFNVTGGGTRCSNGSGLSVDLSGSQTGVNYQLFNGASPVGTPLAGTGSGISFTATNAGTYTVVATDATTSCTSNMTGSATIIVNAAPTVTFTKVFASSCNGGTDGSISVAASGGTSPYTYSWTGVGGFTASTPDITGLALGDYTVVVTDNNVCSTTIPDITIKLAPAPSVGISSRTNPGCSFNDGTITAYRIGGVYDGITAIQYSLDGGVNYQNGNTFTGLPAGSYTVTVKDSKGCTGVSPTVVLSQSAPLSFTSNGYNTNVSACGGGSDGSTTVTVTGGVLPYHYILDGVEKQVSYLNTYTITGLSANISYTVSVTDAKACSISKNVTLDQEAAPTAIIAYKGNVSCIGNNDGFITTGQSGGVPGYTYSKDNGVTYQSSYRFLNLVAGTYNVVVKDSKGCTSAAIPVTINPGTVVCPAAQKGNATEYVLGTPGVNNNANTSLSIQAYPNPFATEFKLNVQGNNKEKVSLIVTDVLGRRWFQAQGNANQQYKLGSGLKKGIYIVQVMQGDKVQTIKIVKE